MALLALIVTQIATSARTESRIAQNLRRGAALQEAADGAVHQAAFRLLDHSDRGWDAHRMQGRHVLPWEGGEVELWLIDGADLININTAPAELLAAAFQVAGMDPPHATALANSVVAWREKSLAETVRTQRDAAYRASGRSYLPPSAPFHSLDELRLVLGMSGDLLTRMAPHLTAFGNYGPAENTLDPLAAAAIASLHRATGYLPLPRVQGQPFFIQITATARSRDGATFTRHAVLQLDPQASGNPMMILEWN